jgi:hypothetical protein
VGSVEELLCGANRALIAVRGRRGPLLSPMAVWYDGAGLWASTASNAVKSRLLRRDGRCLLYVPAPDVADGGVVVGATARVFGPHDPLGTMLHWPTISVAMAALAARNAGNIVGYAQDVARIPLSWMPANRVVVRAHVERAAAVAAPPVGPGIAPALPPVVPADVRRAIGGQRRVVVAVVDGERLRVLPGVWGAGFALSLLDELPGSAPATVVVDDDPHGRPTLVTGLAFGGHLDDRGTALRPERVTWWRGFATTTEDMPAPSASGITLPD